MSKATVFDPFGLMANPWYFITIGLQFMRSWQDAWLSQARFGGFMPVTDAMFMLRLPTSPASVRSPEIEIALRQGRDKPWLGCLTGVQVVGGPESVAPAPIEAKAERVVEAPAAKVEAAREVVAKEVVAKAASAKAPPKKAAAPKAKAIKPVAEPVADSTPQSAVEASPSVTSMLAMQARSLSKAVSKAPKAVAAGAPAASGSKKPAAKKASSKKA